MPSNVWDEITCLFINFNVATVENWEWISNFIFHYNGCNYISMLGLKFIYVSKKALLSPVVVLPLWPIVANYFSSAFMNICFRIYS